ncbi:hypothetical protein [Halomonas denitrificans]|nr:hypothetical protein [Halomonas denitrificans]
MSLMSELKRRNVIRVGLFYLVASWLVVQIAETVLPVFDVPDEFVRGIIVVLAIGFVPALVFAWAFELTPDGLKRDKDVRVDPETKQQTVQKLNVATLIAAVLAIGLLVADRLIPESAAPAALPTAVEVAAASPTVASIAVLPFEDLSQEGNQAYFSDGIAEEILNVLVGVDGLAVASRTSSFQFKGMRAIGIPEIASQLEVRNVLEGSVRTAGNQIRITAQLIDGERDEHVWSETFDRELSTENLFAIQDEIAQAIVQAIRGQLDVELEAPESVTASTTSVDAYGLFLRARALFRSRSFFDEADSLLVRALEIDPDFADALALRAAILVVAPEYGVMLVESAEASRALAEQLTQRALAIDDRLALGYAILGLIQDLRLFDGGEPIRFQEILDSYNAALAIAPEDLAALNWRGFAYLRAGYLDEAKVDFSRCLGIEPGYAPCNSNLVSVLAIAGETDRARDVLDRSIRLGVFTGDIPSLILLHQLGDERGFYFHAIRLPSLRGWLGMEEIHRALDRPADDHGVLLERLRAHGELIGTTRSLDELRLALGEFTIRPPTYSYWFDALRPYRESSAFKKYMHLFGLVEFWQDNGFPPMCRSLGADDFECD